MANDFNKIGNYQIICELGKGAQGKAYKVKWNSRKGEVFGALKLLHNADVKSILKEVSVWANVSQHPNILTFITADEDNGRFFIISELAERGNLETWIEEKGGKQEYFDEALNIMYEILQGLEHLHNNEIIHRDIKPANIFLKGNIPLLADFGLARKLDLSQSTILSGSLLYMSPELINAWLSRRTGDRFNHERTELDDLWAVAVTFQQMLTGELPFENVDAIRNSQSAPISINIPNKIKEFLKTALDRSSSARFQTIREMQNAFKQILVSLRNETILDKNFEYLEFTMSNPHYGNDLKVIDGIWDLKQVMRQETICILTGCNIVAELLDRPVAEMLRDEIDKLGDSMPFRRAIVITDFWWWQEAMDKTHPIIGIGGPANNGITREILERVEPEEINDFRIAYVHEQFPKIAVWGETAQQTRDSVEYFIKERLRDFLNQCWR